MKNKKINYIRIIIITKITKIHKTKKVRICGMKK